ncbi:unnamed protein product [Linum tenue]|uniref:Cytochrome P450 n=1 Tax=Linum tenue TaxID=586396 RepID=A0AAV0M3L2_9ROSI|nr:unnamed protein product [Linum tenue]
MDVLSSLPEILITALAVATFFYLRRLGNNRKHPKNRPVPEIPGGLPLVGHLHLLAGNQTLARTLGSFSDKYGTVFAVRLGANTAVVVSDFESMKQCFTTNDRVLATRPDSVQAKMLSYDKTVFGFAPYGAYLRDIKRILMNEVLALHRVRALRHVRVSELDLLVRDLYQRSRSQKLKSAVTEPNTSGSVTVSQGEGKAVVISEAVHSYVLNIITRIVAGKRYFGGGGGCTDDGRPISEVIKEFTLVMGTLVPSDLIPILGWVLPQGTVKAMKRVFKELDLVMEGWIDEHKKKKREKKEPMLTDNDDDEVNQDLIDVMLSEIKDDVVHGHKRETIIKATALSVIVAGAETSAITLTWVLANLLNHKRVLKLAQEEIDSKVGKDRWVEDSDIESLPYLGAVIKETFRMYPPGPLSFPREASEDITIRGYHVPKGTRFFANFWKLHRDPKVWSDPDQYRPERFLTTNANVEVFGHQFEYLPFGSGRRGCPGINLGMQITQLTLARLVQGFLWSAPEDRPVDMTEGLGLALPKASPLEAVLTPRLSPHLYTA